MEQCTCKEATNEKTFSAEVEIIARLSSTPLSA